MRLFCRMELFYQPKLTTIGTVLQRSVWTFEHHAKTPDQGPADGHDTSRDPAHMDVSRYTTR